MMSFYIFIIVDKYANTKKHSQYLYRNASSVAVIGLFMD